jgi:hypothetical protein
LTFLNWPLNDEVIHLTADEHAPLQTGHRLHDHLFANVGLFVVTGILLMLLQAVHVAMHRQIETLSLYQWILLLELCALPLLVTTFFFGAALHRSELGEHRWSRAIEASIFAGTIVVAPFTIIHQLTEAFPPTSWEPWRVAFATSENFVRLGALVLLIALMATLIGIAIAVIASAATYGVYALALGLAMTDMTRGVARRNVCLAIVFGAVIAQGITSLVVWWLGIREPTLHYLHVVLATGWAAGLYASRFHLEVAQPVVAPGAAAEPI